MFAVFGVTREVARIKAVKLISQGKGTLEEFSDDLDAYTDNVYKIMTPVKLSKTYSSYQQASQYALLAEVDGRNIEIKKKIGDRDSNGDYITDPKTEKIKSHWA